MKKLQEEREKFEASMKEQEKKLEDERRNAEEELETQMKAQLNDQQRVQQFREIEQKLQEIVPMIAEINTICREIGRDQVFYEPEIVTNVNSDGSKTSNIVIRVYPNNTDREESGVVDWETFTDTVYFKVKDLYETAEENNFDQSKYNFSEDG